MLGDLGCILPRVPAVVVRAGGELAIIFADTATRDLWVTGLTVLIDFAGMPKSLAARRPRTVWLENLVVAAGEHNRFQKSLLEEDVSHNSTTACR